MILDLLLYDSQFSRIFLFDLMTKTKNAKKSQKEHKRIQERGLRIKYVKTKSSIRLNGRKTSISKFRLLRRIELLPRALE